MKENKKRLESTIIRFDSMNKSGMNMNEKNKIYSLIRKE